MKRSILVVLYLFIFSIARSQCIWFVSGGAFDKSPTSLFFELKQPKDSFCSCRMIRTDSIPESAAITPVSGKTYSVIKKYIIQKRQRHPAAFNYEMYQYKICIETGSQNIVIAHFFKKEAIVFFTQLKELLAKHKELDYWEVWHITSSLDEIIWSMSY